jgi:hypothetical protein
MITWGLGSEADMILSPFLYIVYQKQGLINSRKSAENTGFSGSLKAIWDSIYNVAQKVSQKSKVPS